MKKRYLLILAVLAFLFGVIQLARNSNNAIALKNQVLARDAAGQNATTELEDLNKFVKSHMNASITFTRESAYHQAVANANPKPAVSGEVYAKAQAACAGRSDSVTQARCVTDYLARNAPTTQAQPAALPNVEDYTVSLVSPRYTTDLAGLSFMVSTIAVALAFWYWLMRKW